MTSTSSSDLMMAILAMDAYNRGYNASLDIDKIKQIGSATVSFDSSDKFSVEATRASGFYAVAYTWNGKTIISYRGTDNPSFFADPVRGASDVWSGWAIGAGYADASQAAWAEKFYQAVTNQSVWTDTAPSNVVLTGHSLGGGLAEYVAALARTSALVFDTMPAGGAAALAWISQNPDALAQVLIDALTAGYGPQLIAMPSATNIRHIYTGGEVLEAIRALADNKLISALGAALSGADPALAAAAASYGTALDRAVSATRLTDFANLRSANDLHSQTLVVMDLWAQGHLMNDDWLPTASTLLDALFDDDLALKAGAKAKNDGGSGSASTKLQTMIAYSALDEGVRPFGDTAIRAMFDDASDLGLLLAQADVSSTLKQAAPALSQAFVQFVGQLAVGVVTQVENATATDGILSNDVASGNLIVDLSTSRWSIGRETSGGQNSIVGRNELIDVALNDTVELPPSGSPGPTTSPAKLGMLRLWGDADYERIEKLVFAETNDGRTVDLNDDAFSPSSSDESVFFLAGDGNDLIRGSTDADMASGGGGADILFGGTGSDLLLGGDGDDLLLGGQSAGDEVNSSLDVRVDHSVWNDGKSDYLAGGIGYDTYLLYGESVWDPVGESANTFHGYFNYSYYLNAKNTVDIINDTDGSGQLKIFCQVQDVDAGTGNVSSHNDIGTVDLDGYVNTSHGQHHVGLIMGSDDRQLSSLSAAIIKTLNVDGTARTDLALISAASIYTQKIVGVIEDFQQGEFGITVDDSADVYFEGSSAGDTINGTSGDDGLDGGGGNDTLLGGDGSDSYQIGIGSGNDTISDTSGDEDVVQFGGGITADMITLSRSGTNAENLILGGGEAVGSSISVMGQFAAGTQRIESFQFADWTIWSWQDIQNTLLTSSISESDDIIDGFATSDVIDALAGDDTIRTHGGSDTIDGGAGFDTVEFDGSLARYRITRDADGVQVVDTTNDDTTVMTNVEAIRFREYSTTVLLTDAPTLVAGNTGFAVEEDTTLHLTTADLLASVYDSEGGVDTIVAVGDAVGGVVSIDDQGNITFAPDNDFFGAASFSYVVENAGGARSTGNVSVAVSPVNDAPVLTASLTDQSAQEDTAVSFTLPSGAFTDIDGDTLPLLAALADGTALPVWLAFDPATGTFTGTPPSDWNGSMILTVTATDPAGAIASGQFVLTIDPVNDAPALAIALPDQSGIQDTTVSFTLPVGTFTDVDGDTLTMSATLADGDALPDWLAFDAVTGAFAGTPPAGWNGAVAVKVTAADPAGAVASGQFTLTIDPADVGGSDDTYLYARGDGDVVIVEEPLGGTADRLVFSDLNVSDVNLFQSGSDLVVQIAESTIGAADEGSVLLKWSYDRSDESGVESIVFADGTTWDRAAMQAHVNAVFDTLTAGASGDDLLLGTSGSDILFGGDGHDDLEGGDRNDLLFGGAGDDSFNGGLGDDLIDGGEGSEDWVAYWDSSSGVDLDLTAGTAVGEGSGNDTIVDVENVWATGFDDTLVGNGADNELYGGAGDDTISGVAGDDYLDGGEGADELIGGLGNDVLVGGNGDDVLNGGAGDDVLDGGEGDDWLSYWDATAGVSIDLASGVAQGASTGTDTIIGIERIWATQFDDDLVGGVGNDELHGWEGADSLRGSLGDDLIDGGEGSEDWVAYWDSSSGVDLDLTAGTAVGEGSGNDTIVDVENVWATSFDDALVGNGADNELYGDTGDDTISGMAGDDYLDGGEGTDELVGGLGNDVLVGGSGDDVYRYASGDGWDVIDDQGGEDDRLVFADLNASDIRLLVVGADLQIGVLGTGETLTDTGHFTSASRGLDQIAFADGTTWSRADIVSHLAA